MERGRRPGKLRPSAAASPAKRVSSKSIILLRWRLPEKKWVYAEWNILVEKWDSKVRLILREGHAVMVRQAWANQCH